MSYPSEIVSEAYRILRERRSQSAEKTNKMRAAVFATLPQARQIERELSATSAKLANAILTGDDVEGKVKKIRDYNIAGQEKLKKLLTENGFVPDALEEKYFCSRCRDTGVAGDGSVCGCVHEIEKNLMLGSLRKSASCTDMTFDTFDLSFYEGKARQLMQSNYNICKNYAESFSKTSESLFLMGSPGLGKTHLSLAISERVTEKGYYVLYIPFHRLITQLEQARFGGSDDKYAYIMHEPLSCDLLVLDDLGSELSTQFTAAALYEIINTRLLAKHPTIINTNLARNDILDRYEERIYSRLFGEYHRLMFLGEDIRLKKINRAKEK